MEYFQTVCTTLVGMQEDPQGCLLWATAMGNLVELKAPSWNGASNLDAPSLHLAASALERGHAAIAGDAPSYERAHLLASRAECAGLVCESLTDNWTAAMPWAASAAQLWEETLAEELAAQAANQYTPEASVETLCSLGSASMVFGKLVLTCGTEALDAKTRRAAQAAVKRALDAFEEASCLCDSSYRLSGLELGTCRPVG